MGIERFLRLSKKEIERRIEEERRKIPKTLGTEYLEQRLMRFKSPEWQFLDYHAHYNPDLLAQALEQYSCYDGNEVKAAIIESLREKYILAELLTEQKILKANRIIASS
ncbi:hypothetical protein J4422_02860 [Candidatus Pacearchaeota archaeon]|nr:hypothetical protein [Candidatus Pacearchaeota archaeon]